jgi:hypothetical protein
VVRLAWNPVSVADRDERGGGGEVITLPTRQVPTESELAVAHTRARFDLEAEREGYIQLLKALIARSDPPPAHVFDRLERLLGLADDT